MNVYEKLQTARIKLQDKNLKKSGKNTYSGFTYYELSDIMPSINEIFNELKLCSIFSMTPDYATLEIINSEKSDEKMIFGTPTAELQLKGCTAIQSLGGVHTYCRRYLYLNALEIVENDMLDVKAGKIEEEKPKKQTPLDDNTIYQLIAETKTVTRLEQIWNQYNGKVADKEALKALCAARKQEIMKGNKNNE